MSGEQSEERVTLWREDRAMPWQGGPPPLSLNPRDLEYASFVRSPSPVDTDSCPTCGSDDPEIHKLSNAFNSPADYPADKLCPDRWHSRSQAGEG